MKFAVALSSDLGWVQPRLEERGLVTGSHTMVWIISDKVDVYFGHKKIEKKKKKDYKWTNLMLPDHIKAMHLSGREEVFMRFIKCILNLALVVFAFNPSTWEAETGGSP